MFIKWNFFSLHKKVEKAFHKTNERRQQQNETLDLCKIMGHYNEQNQIRSTNNSIDVELFWIKIHFIFMFFILHKMKKCRNVIENIKRKKRNIRSLRSANGMTKIALLPLEKMCYSSKKFLIETCPWLDGEKMGLTTIDKIVLYITLFCFLTFLT